MAEAKKTIYDDIYEAMTSFYCPEETKDLTLDEALGLRKHIEDKFDSFIADLVNDIKKADYIGYKWD